MKKIFFILFSILAVIFMGCSKQLKEKTYGFVAELNTVSDIQKATVGIYEAVSQAGIFQTQSFFPMVEVGDRYASYGSSGETIGNLSFYKYLFTPSSNEILLTWQNFYKLINRANDVIYAAEKNIADTAIADNIISEARFLRGWAYFVLTQLWGKVPLHIEPTGSLSEVDVIYKSRASIEEIYSQVVSDLTFASSKLPLTRPTDELGRVTAATAIGMLGKVYLTMAGRPLNKPENYDSAINILTTLAPKTARAKFHTDILTVYSNIFLSTNEMNSEVLFALRSYANSASIVYGSQFPYVLPPKFSGVDADMALGETPTYGLRWDILRLFEPFDVRVKDGIGGEYPDMRSTTISPAGIRDTLVYDTTTLFRYKSKRTGATVGAAYYGIGYTKWRPNVTRALSNNPRSYNNDWIILRLADVLLCYAEALNEKGRTSEALIYLNEVRFRSQASTIVSTDQGFVREVIRKERKRELVGEFTTVFDMRRWGTLQEEMDNFQSFQFRTPAATVIPKYDEKFYLYPVPYAELTKNPLLNPQNNGW